MQRQEGEVDRGITLEVRLIVTECSGTKSDKQDTNSSSGNYTTHAVDANIRPVNDQEPFVEVQLTAQHNILANEQHHSEQSEPIYDTFTLHYLPKVREYVLANPHHVIAPGLSRNNQEESYGSNDMAHNHYLEESRKKTQEKNRNLKPSVMHTTSLQNTTNDSKQKPRSNNQASWSLPVSKSSGVTLNSMPLVDHSRNPSLFLDSKHFVCLTCQKCVFNANHDACVTKFLNEILIGHRFSPNKSSAVYEKTSPRSCLRCKPTGRIFNTVGLRPADPTGLPVTTSLEHDAPYESTSSNQEQDQSLTISQGADVQTEQALFEYTPVQNILNRDSSSQESSLNVQLSYTPFELLGRWTKNHPLTNVIGNPSRSVFTRKQL
ncbi:hypothetical protein Tco_0923997 [Tanacetum coccineum]|uniref:Uncharacterized protein n=1 Tax=Tanacetum coccineum TaxID=301880 RepID=A0ABQ5D3N8_9ASTR